MFKKSHVAIGVKISTGDYIDPTPWTPEVHERFKKAMERVRELRSAGAIEEARATKQTAKK